MDGCKGLIYICACIRGIDLVMPAQEQRDKKMEIHLSFYLTCNSTSPHLDKPCLFEYKTYGVGLNASPPSAVQK